MFTKSFKTVTCDLIQLQFQKKLGMLIKTKCIYFYLFISSKHILLTMEFSKHVI